MTEEEKKAIKYFYNLRKTIDESYLLFDEGIDVKCGKEMIKQITSILNLIQNQQKEIECLKQAGEATEMLYKMQLEKRDKIIDEMAPYVYLDKYMREEMKKDIYNNVNNHKGFKEWVKQYFERKVER